MWTFQNQAVTFIFQHASRGKAAIDSHFPDGLPRSMIVSDRHTSYFNIETAGHQLCLAHLIRNLVYLSELNQKQTWSTDMLDLLRDSIRQRKSVPYGEIDVCIKDRFNRLMQEMVEKEEQMEQEISRLTEKRSKTDYKIPLGKMPEKERYTKLHQESKYLMNIIKMICYRAETALANKLASHFKRADHEIRMLVKAITHLSIDLIPDYTNSLLNITLYPPANLRSHAALANVIDEVNATNTVFPGTNLIMRFKIFTMTVEPQQDEI
jgi:hypothetical protein